MASHCDGFTYGAIRLPLVLLWTVEWKPSGAKRRPGRPKRTWLKTVKEDLKLEGGDKTMEDLEEMALDRSRWLWTALCARARGKD